MNIVCVADAYITKEMMYNGISPYLSKNDNLKILYFGENNRTDMRNIVKSIESGNRLNIPIPHELSNAIIDADILIVHLCPVNADLISKSNNLKAILSCRGGLENIDIDFATKRNIIITNNPSHNANAVAEYTIGLMICETRNISRANESLKKNIWRESFPNTNTTIREMSDLTIGIIGFGSVGRLVAKKLTAFNSKVLIFDPYINENAYDLLNYHFVDLKTLLQESDIVSLHARSKTYILDFNEFSIMKPTSYLINTARSSLVNPEALHNALETKQILGCAIDVFENEPIIPEFYRQYDNITITNHRGGDTINSYSDSPKFVINNYLNYLENNNLKFWVNKNALIKEF